jgi:hypothetical protein
VELPLLYTNARIRATFCCGAEGERRRCVVSRVLPPKEQSFTARKPRRMNRRVAAVASACLCAAISFAPLSARADVSEASALSAGLLEPANASLQRALNDLKAAPESSRDVAQANPVGTPQAPIRRPSLPQGFTYNVDVNMGFPVGDVGFNAGDPGGMDAGFGYAFSRTNRVQVGYYEVQQVPVGFSNANVPLYLQGYTGPGTTLPGASLGRVNTGLVDVTTKDKIFQVGDQNLFVIGGKVPIVITPTYLAHWATIGGRNDDGTLAEFDGFPSIVRLRTEQEWLLPVTLPFLATPRMFGTLTVAPQWLVHEAGFNQTNHAQIFSLLYLEYRASKSTTFFIQPSRLVQYDPVDPYPMYTPSIIYGIAHHFTPQTFIQLLGIEGYASNYPQYGIESLTCQRLPCSSSQVAPQFGGLHAAEYQIQFGIGSPTVVPL